MGGWLRACVRVTGVIICALRVIHPDKDTHGRKHIRRIVRFLGMEAVSSSIAVELPTDDDYIDG